MMEKNLESRLTVRLFFYVKVKAIKLEKKIVISTNRAGTTR
jgi:hypothetical protein